MIWPGSKSGNAGGEREGAGFGGEVEGAGAGAGFGAVGGGLLAAAWTAATSFWIFSTLRRRVSRCVSRG